MGSFLSRYSNSDDYSSDDSSYTDSEEEEEGVNDNFTNMELNKSPNNEHQVPRFEEPDNCFDSATDSLLSVDTSVPVMSLIEVMFVEKNLEIYEKVSLIYLLYDDPKVALQDLNKLLFIQDSGRLIYDWVMCQNELSSMWQEKFIEALCIIQNYHILKRLGFQRKDMDEQFFPQTMFTSMNVNKIRKALYLLCEELIGSETQKFIHLVHADFNRKGLEFKMFKTPYLELFFSYWESINYIKIDDLSNICSILKQMEYFDMADRLKLIIPPSDVSPRNILNNQRIEKDRLLSINKTDDTNKKPDSIFQGILSDKSLLDLKSSESLDTGINTSDSNRYIIDPTNPGVCLIISQENFYREVDPALKHLLPENILEVRKGTQKDKQRLEATFKMFNFKTKVIDNLTHTGIIEEIKKFVRSVTVESSLFVCIMSHGDEGVIYGVNSCRVAVRTIQKLICSENRKNLSGKPKVLILQSCQGNRCQKISCDDEHLTTDGPSTNNKPKGVPEIVDLFTFWATVPGYGAIRNKVTGSWFIQSFCQKMEELGNKEHFEGICTAVVYDVSDRKWIKEGENVAMVPLKESTFRQNFYLPSIRN